MKIAFSTMKFCNIPIIFMLVLWGIGHTQSILTAFTGQLFSHTIITEGTSTFNMESAPVGMTINEVTGVITWTPTMSQVLPASVSIRITKPDGGSVFKKLQVKVTAAQAYLPGLYVAKNGVDAEGYGTADKPYASITYASKQTKPGDTVYVRGGVYSNQGYGDGNLLKRGDAVRIAQSGSDGKPITYLPFGNEKVKIVFDASVGIAVRADYIIISGFEVEGVAATMNYQSSLSHWWKSSYPSMNRGLGIGTWGHHIIVENCVVHHTPGNLIGGVNCDYITIRNNIGYNGLWWALEGPGAIEFHNLKAYDHADVPHIVISGNLIFGCEQRIFSRIIKRNLANLTIDEGHAIGLMVSGAHSKGTYVISNNLLLYNGKGIEPQANDVVLTNNSVYMEKSTVGGKTTGIITRSITNGIIKWNASHVGPERVALNLPAAKPNTYLENYGVGWEKQKDLPSTNVKVEKLFRDPQNLDFRMAEGIPDYIGVPESELTRMMAMADNYGITIKPTGWLPDYYGMTKWIVENRPDSMAAFDLRISYDYTAVDKVFPLEGEALPKGSVTFHPVKKELEIHLPENQRGSVELRSLKGKLIFSQTNISARLHINMETIQMKKGLYVVFLRYANCLKKKIVPYVL